MSLIATKSDLELIEDLTAIGPEVKRLLREARIAIESVYLPSEDKEDVADSLRRFAKELGNPYRHPERLMRYWARINDLAPTVAHMLAKSEAVQELSMCWGDCIQTKGGFLNEIPAREFVESIEDPSVRYALEWAFAQMLEMSFFEGTRPEGTFDLLYFYKLLASLLDTPYIQVKLPSTESASGWRLVSGG
jgi:hypothetical protein